MAPKFSRWVHDLFTAVDVGPDGSKRMLDITGGGGSEWAEGGGQAVTAVTDALEDGHELYQTSYIIGERRYMCGGDGHRSELRREMLHGVPREQTHAHAQTRSLREGGMRERWREG